MFHGKGRKPVGQGLSKSSSKVTLEHKIKLKKRLAKAYAKLDNSEEGGHEHQVSEPEHSFSNKSYNRDHQRGGNRPKKTVQHQSHKPDPMMAARQAQAQAEAQRAEEQARKDADIEAALKRKAEAQQARKDKKIKMMARTRKGQPVLSNQIDGLLQRIQKNMQ